MSRSFAGRWAYVLVVALVVVGTLAVVSRADAYTVACTDPLAFDQATCERAEAAAASAAHTDSYIEILAVGVWFLFGGVLMLIAAPMMTAAFRWWRE